MLGDNTTNSTARDDGYSEYVTPQRKRQKRSKVWKELVEGKNAEGERIATFTHCRAVLIAHRGAGTSHLRRHLERCVDRPICFRNEGDNEGDFVFDMNVLRNENY